MSEYAEKISDREPKKKERNKQRGPLQVSVHPSPPRGVVHARRQGQGGEKLNVPWRTGVSGTRQC